MAADPTTRFLPASPLFQPLQADPREARTSLVRSLKRPQWEGSIGRTIELVQWGPGVRKAWGITGAAFAWLDQHGTSFPLRASDWWLGTYVARRVGRLSHKFEYTHVSTHLGDALSGERKRIVYSREMLRLLLSVEKRAGHRYYLGVGYWVKAIPREDPWFFQTGVEHILGMGRGPGQALDLYLAADLKYKQEAGGTFNKTVQAGLRLRPAEEDGHGIRFGFSFFSGKSEFGQFYTENDTHWTCGLFFD